MGERFGYVVFEGESRILEKVINYKMYKQIKILRNSSKFGFKVSNAEIFINIQKNNKFNNLLNF